MYRLQLEMDVPVIAASALVALVPNLLASSIIQRSCPCDPSGLWPVDRGAVGNESHSADVASTVTEVLAVVVPPLLDLADVGPTTAWAEDAVVFGETLLVNEALLTAVKYAVQRPRPFLYAHPELASDPEGYLSFYSGHTSATFAALAATAFTMRLRHGDETSLGDGFD